MQSIFSVLVLCFFLINSSSCKKEEESTPVNLTAEAPSEITETSFVANWSITTTDINSLKVEVSSKPDFIPLVKTVSVTNVSIKSQLIDQLNGASNYFYRVICQLNDGTTLTSESKKVETTYQTDIVSFKTSDGYTLAASIKYLESNTAKNPGIIFMHELGVFVNNWKNAELVTNLIAQGYVCMILDFRGHGQSDNFDLQEIADDIGIVAPDLVAAIDFLKSHQSVDPQNIGLAGGSLGAIMSIAGNGYEEVKCTVSLSGARNGIYSIFDDLEINSAFFIVGENDNGGGIDFPGEAVKLFELASEPKKLKVIAGNSAHGTNLLTEGGLNEEIIDWINSCFEN